jgi:hypothetical protein
MFRRRTLLLINLGILPVLALCAVCSAQEPIDRAFKLDEFPDMKADDTQARLDILAERLSKDSNLQSFIVTYRPEDWPHGLYLRTVHGYVKYLVETRGIPSERIRVIENGTKPELKIELWLAPKELASPVALATESLALSLPLQFDTLWFGPGCEGEFTLTLEDPRVSAHFFGKALRETPTAKGFLFLHPTRSMGDGIKLLSTLKADLINKERVPAERFVGSIATTRTCAQIDAWLVPVRMVVTDNKDPDVFLRFELMSEAERSQYNIRRVEFVGNAHIRDNVLRRRIPELQEGELFTKTALTRSLAALTRFKAIRPVGIKDVDVHLNRADKTIDLALFFTERTMRKYVH